jgi:ATP-binding cassette subfamily B protein
MDPRQGALSGLHILVVDDNHDAREIFRLLLQYFGAQVSVAQGSREALALLRHAVPDVMLVDMLLGKDDGVRLLQDVRKQRVRAPVIAVSGQDFDIVQLEGAGFAGYLRKPVDHERLMDTILKVTGR